MPFSLLNHSALALFAQRTRIPTSARSIGFCAIWVCMSSSSSINWPSAANSLAHMQLKRFFVCLCDCFGLAFLCFETGPEGPELED